MGTIFAAAVAPGLHWVSIPEAGLHIQCGCCEDSVKHLIRRGVISPVEKNGISWETGPNAILLSDIMLQGGHFSNLAEFPVLQMLYRQGMGIPRHPNNSGTKPLLIGSFSQIQAQLEYIYRGNYGLISIDELCETGLSREEAELVWHLKMEFAHGQIKPTDHFLDSVVIGEGETEIRAGATIRRDGVNQFTIAYKGESASVDLNIPRDRRYPAPYPLGFHDFNREYFGIVHSGQGDGWDINRSCMSSILVYKGKLYLIDAGPNIAYSLIALGIGISEIEGIFHTHCHDDHFAGLPTLLLSDHRIKYYATPFVRASVFKKISALLSLPEADFFDFFEVHDLQVGTWNNIDGLEVKPQLSPHPVETTTFTFRALGEDRFYSYAHLTDITSCDSLRAREGKSEHIPDGYLQKIIDGYLAPADLKKIDIGTDTVHGQAADFKDDCSGRLILGHTSVPLNNHQKEIGSSAPFGMFDVLIKSRSDFLVDKARSYLSDYLAGVEANELDELLNSEVVKFNPGTIMLKRGAPTDFLYLLLSGIIEKIDAAAGICRKFSTGSLIGESYGDGGRFSKATYRTISFVHALKISASGFYRLAQEHHLLNSLKQMHERKDFLLHTWLFGEALSPRIEARIGEHLIPFEFEESRQAIELADGPFIFLIRRGSLAREYRGRVVEELGAGDFFGEDLAVFGRGYGTKLRVQEGLSGYKLHAEQIRDIPVIRWKLLEMHQKRGRALKISSG